MNWFTFVCLSIVFLVTPFQWGLYYESDIYPWERVIFGLFVLNVIWYWIKKPEVLLKNKNYLLVLLLPFMYVLTIPFALNPEGNWNTIFRFAAYSFFFLLLIWTKESPSIKKLYPLIFHLLGITFFVFAFANLFNFIHLDEYMIGCTEERACGPVRYPNTFGAIIGAYFFYTLTVVIHRKSIDWVSILFVHLTVGYGAILLHTYSRGSYIIFAGTFVLVFLLLSKHWRKFLLFSISPLFLLFVVFNLLQHAGIIVTTDSRVLDFSPTTPNAAARIDFYKEAIVMSKESPWIGFGGESWTIYYPKYEKEVLGLNQVHNGYLDFLIEIGWIGITIYALFFILLIYLIFKSRTVSSDKTHSVGVILALTMLFGHGMVDYDFSYGTIWLLIFWLFAIGLREVDIKKR